MSAIKTWYADLNQRERMMVTLLGLALAILLVMLLVVMPLKNYQKGLSADRDYMANRLGNLKSQVASLKRSPTSASGLGLNQQVTKTAGQFGLTFSRIEERKRNKEIQVRLDNAEFDKLIRWVSDLEQKNGLIIENFRVSKGDAIGRVDVSLKIIKAS